MKEAKDLTEAPTMTKKKELCVGETLSLLLRGKKMTAKELSQRAGVPLSSVHHIINNRPIKNIMALERIAEELGVSLHFLLFGKPDEREEKNTTLHSDLFSGLFEIVVRKHEK